MTIDFDWISGSGEITKEQRDSLIERAERDSKAREQAKKEADALA